MTETTTTTEAAAAPGSQPLKNPRHELFAQEVAGGQSKTAAFLEAYPHAAEWKPSAAHVKASTMAAREDVRERVSWLQERAADGAVFTRAQHIARLNALSRAAEKAGEFTAAVKAEENRGKAAGFYPTRVELTGKGGGPIETKQTRDLTDEEFREACRKHGIEP
jgi:hypothetical protein